MARIFIGPGGTAGLGYEEGIKRIKELELDALEIEFTYGVRMKEQEALKIGELARKNKIRLSVHGPYYINLVSKEKEKIAASRERIIKSCEIGDLLGADYIVFHAGFYQQRSKREVYDSIMEEITRIKGIIKENGWKTKIAPELTGKHTQFGDIDELLRLRKDTGCSFTIDFAHLLARQQGRIDYDDVLNRLKGIKHIHSHISGIEWGIKGEKKHLPLKDNDVLPLIEAVRNRNVSITIIHESPDPINDAHRTRQLLG